MITTFEFYQKTYYGDSIKESSDFNKWESRAEDKLRSITQDNLTDEALVKFNKPLQKAACAIADLLYEIDKATKTATATDETNVKSRSSGGESITYGDNKTLVTAVLSDKRAQNRLIYDTAVEYLAGTGLLYAGV